VSAALLSGLAAQSTLGAALGLGGLWLLRHRSPLDRATWAKLALALLLAMPLLPRVHLPMPPVLAPMLAPALTSVMAPVATPVPASHAQAQPVIAPTAQRVTLPLWLVAYGLGVAGLMGRLALGLALLRRWTGQARPLEDGRWRQALKASGAPASTRLLVSERLSAPLSWGLRHPVILIDPASALRPGDAPAILAHEAAHIARADWLALMAARVATAVFWFNPLVWMLSRALVQHCEEAADARALLRCQPIDYAATLMTCLAGHGDRRAVHGLPANGMAAGHGLSRRVHRVLDAAPGALLRRSRGVVAGLAGVAALAVAGSLVSFARAAETTPETTKAAPPVRVVHADGSVETIHSDTHGRTTIRVVSADGRRISVTRFGGQDSALAKPAAPAMPAAPAAPMTAMVPPVPPTPPVVVTSDGDSVSVMSRAEIARIRDEAMREASRARAEGLAEAAAGRAEAERARVEARAIVQEARREALAQASQASQIRAEALAQADQIRSEALALARASRRAAHRDTDD